MLSESRVPWEWDIKEQHLDSITASATPAPAVPGKSTAAPAEKDVAGLSQTLNSPDRSVSRYDFFIAYATPDRRQAQDLCWFLQDDACEVFLDVQDLSPGAVMAACVARGLGSVTRYCGAGVDPYR